MEQKKMIYMELDRLGVVYQAVEHPAVFTIDEMDALEELEHKEDIVKNLFLRDAKGRRHFLVVMDKNKKADMKLIREQLGTSTLSFASEERLMEHLGLTKGAVTPLGTLNDKNCSVEVVMDRSLSEKNRIGVHPNDNTATVFLSFQDLYRVIEKHGNPIRLIDL